MGTIGRLWFAVIVTLLALIALVQAYDAIVWARAPWLGLTLGAHGRVIVRGEAEAALPLRALLREQSLDAIAVNRDGVWHELTATSDRPPYQAWSRPRTPYDRLRRALAGAKVGDAVVLRLRDHAGADHDIELPVRQIPVRTALERILLFHGIGLFVVAFGAAVLYSRPSSGQALAFALLAMASGGQLLTTQVLGGFPSRFYWLSVGGCYATPAAAATLALALHHEPWSKRRRWVASVPWVFALAAMFAAALHGTLEHDANPFIIGLRVFGWSFFAVYILWGRMRQQSAHEVRRLEYYLAGMATTFALPTWSYTQPRLASDPVSPWVMLPLGLFPIVIGYGILKHRLFNVEVVFRRGLAYTALGVVAVAIYGLLAAAATTLLGSNPLVGSPLLTAVFVTIAAVFGVSLRSRLQELVDRGVNPARFRYLAALRAAGQELAALDNPQQIAERLVRIATDQAELAGAAVFVRRLSDYRLAAAGGTVTAAAATRLRPDEPLVSLAALVGSEIHRDDFGSNPRLDSVRVACTARMDELGVNRILPLKTDDGHLVGLFALAPRRDESPLNSEDLDLLAQIAAHAAAAIGRSLWDDRLSATTEATAAPVVLGPGVHLGHYIVERKIGRGGMGSVHQARDKKLDRVVALKFLNEDRLESPAMRERLRREARALAALNHPSIMQIHALEEIGGHIFLAVEFLEGETLRAELDRRGRLPPTDAVEVCSTLVAALDYALVREIIHRDVKLENVMRSGGMIKLADFGLAKLASSDESAITQSGLVVGTPAYLAPELLDGAAASYRSDMYALGVLLFILLTGQPLWRNTHERRSQPIGAADLVAHGVPQPLAWTLQCLLEIDPKSRYSSYGAIDQDLRRARTALSADP